MASERASDDAAARIAAVQRACEEAIKALREMPDPQARLEEAAGFSRMLADSRGEAAQVRYEAAAEIHEREKLSLAQLARRVGISKQRADQIVKKAQAREREGGADE